MYYNHDTGVMLPILSEVELITRYSSSRQEERDENKQRYLRYDTRDSG